MDIKNNTMINTTEKIPIIGIYKIISPTGKIDIGQSININKRWRKYMFLSCKNQIRLYNSLLKYGFDGHTFEIIEECLREQLNDKEVYWKKYYLCKFNNEWERVLFCKIYDGGGGPISMHIKEKISKSLLGKIKTQKHKENISKSRTGIIFTQQHKDNMSNSRFRYSILCVENNTIYKSAHHASKELHIFPAPIIKVCKGEYKQTKGYTFKFMDNDNSRKG